MKNGGERRERNRWVATPNMAAGQPVNVFCFPFAGGGASFYRAWARHAPPSLTLCPIQPPGREERMAEPPLDKMGDFVQAALEGLAPYLSHPFALFGHSMGAMVSWELAQALRARGGPQPVHLFVSGAPAPHLASLLPRIDNLPHDRFIEAVRRLGGLPEEVLSSTELLEFLIPRFRADLAVTGTHVYREHPPLTCPITAFAGDRDELVGPATVEAWREYTLAAFRCEIFSGGHFFLNDFAQQIIARLASAVS
jgi:medium-chain acyl-[acyl-carrier-protein] hydrolase